MSVMFLTKSFMRWLRDTTAVAAVEFALIFPVMMILLMGLFDLGNGIMANQRIIASVHTIADLLARNEIVDDDIINSSISGGELVVAPFSIDTMGVDIVSIRFDEDGAPETVWRETRNMAANTSVPGNTQPLSQPNEGVLVVTVRYLYRPAFGQMVIGDIPMEEMAIIRGRRTAVVERE